MSFESELGIIEADVRELANKGKPTVDDACLIADKIKSLQRSYPKKYLQYSTGIILAFDWVSKLAAQRQMRTLGERMAAAIVSESQDQASKAIADLAKKRCRHGLPEVVADFKKEVDFHLMMTFRDYHHRLQKDYWIAPKAYEKFVVMLAEAIETTLRKSIHKNIQASFKEGGRLSDDITPGDRKWPNLSEKYVGVDEEIKGNPKKKGKNLRHFGVLTGGMKRNIWREGAVKIHFKGGTRGEGAKTVSVDFATSKAGKKLAWFYFGHNHRKGYQPPRPFTFLRQRNLAMLTKIIQAAFSKLTLANYSIFAGVRVGHLPAARTGAEFEMFKIWTAAGKASLVR